MIKRSFLLSLFAGVLLLAFACHGILTPPTGPDTPYPCGIRGVTCQEGACCPENHLCGFDGPFSRCPEGYCCYDGPHWPYSATPDGGGDASAPMVKKTFPDAGGR
jgi:hypothetical protein